MQPNPRLDNPRLDSPHLDNPRLDKPRLDNPHLDNPHLDNVRALAARALPEMLGDLKRLVECESPSSEPASLHRCAQLLEDIVFARLGRRPDWRGPSLPHRMWRWGRGDAVLLLGHFDTVWPRGTLADLPFSCENGVIRGPGCYDMKAGLVIAIHSIAILYQVGGAEAVDGICLFANADEEVGSHDSRPVIEEAATGRRAVLVFEGADESGAVKTARKGTSHYVIRVRGRGAHAGLEPEKGHNAALEVARLALAVAELSDVDRQTTVTPTVMNAGTSRNTVPERAELFLDVRTVDATEQHRVDQAVRRLVAEPSPFGCVIELEGGPNRPPLPRQAARELFAMAQRASRALGLGELGEVTAGGGSDGNFTADLGLPTLDGLGAVGAAPHARSERVHVGQLADRVALVTVLLDGLLHNRLAAGVAEGVRHG